MGEELIWPYHPLKGGQERLWDACHPKQNKSLIGFFGPRGIGKSISARGILLSLGFKMGLNMCLIRKELEDIKGNHIEPIKTELKPWFDKRLIRYNAQDKLLTFPYTGSAVKFEHCNNDSDLNSFQGKQYDLIVFEEAGQLTPFQIIYILGTNRPSDIARTKRTSFKPRSIFTFNWGGPAHHLLRRWFYDGQRIDGVHPVPDLSVYDPQRKENPDNFYSIWGRFEENTVIQEMDPHYQDKLALNSEKYRRAYIDGDPDSFSGTFFNISKLVHEVKPFEIPTHWRILGAVDPGRNAPCSFGLYAIDPEYNVYKIYNYYQGGKGFRDHVSDIYNLITTNPAVTKWTRGRLPQFIVAGVDAFSKTDRYSINATDVTMADLFSRAGLHCIKADTHRVQGWAALSDALEYKFDFSSPDKTDEERLEKPPRLRFFKGQCEDTLKELTALEESETNPEDIQEGMGIMDHAADETRYFIMSALKARQPVSTKTEEIKRWDYGRGTVMEDAFTEYDNYENQWENWF